MERPEKIKEFMPWFKNQSEIYFEKLEVDKNVFGLQHQPNTKWKQGLTNNELEAFQMDIGFQFPEILIEFYKTMNGTNISGVNVYGNQGVEYLFEPIFFSYPEHIINIKEQIDVVLNIQGLTINEMKKSNISFIFPICRSYFMIIDYKKNPIYFLSSAHKNHNIKESYVYGSLWTDSLQNFLIKNTFFQCDHISDLEEFPDIIRKKNYWDV